MATEMEELVDFLSSPSPPVKKAAVDIVRGLTGSEDGLQSLGAYAKILLLSLVRLLSENKEVSEPAAEALVNLSQNSNMANKMVSLGVVKTAMDILYKPDSSITKLLIMLLVNLTQLDNGIASLLQTEDEKMQGLYLMRLVRSFCRSTDSEDDPFEHIGSILVNLSKSEAGRRILLDPKRALLKQIIRQFDSSSPIRKKGVAGTIRNCCFEAESQLQNLLMISEFLWPVLLLPVAGNKEVSEPAAEALVNLSQNSNMANKMVSLGVVKTAMDILYKPDSSITKLLIMLLVNLTQLDNGIASLLQTEDEKMQGLYLMRLVRSFCRSTDSEDDPFEHIGSILVNLSKSEAGRRILLDPKRALLKQIIRQFDSSSPIRKKGVAGTIRNCCFEAESQLQNLLMISEFLWPVLLLPVAGNKVYNEEDASKMPLELGTALSIEREPVNDPEIRVQTLEAVYLIALQEAGRRALWSVNGPRILQIGYEDEDDPKVMEAYERVGSLLVHGPGTEEPSTDIAK